MYQEPRARNLLTTQRSRPRAWAGGAAELASGVPEAGGFVHAFLEQQVDVAQQKLAAAPSRRHHGLAARWPRRPARRSTGSGARLDQPARRSPPIADSRCDDLPRLDAIAGAEHGNPDGLGDCADQAPVGLAGVGLRGRAAVNRDRRGAGVFDHARQASAR